MQDLDYLYAHHAVGVCPEERCVAARERLAALVTTLQAIYDDARRLDGTCRWCEAGPPDEVYDHDVACPAAKSGYALGLPGYRGYNAIVIAIDNLLRPS